jgi:hypothetical protein
MTHGGEWGIPSRIRQALGFIIGTNQGSPSSAANVYRKLRHVRPTIESSFLEYQVSHR